MTGPIIEPEFLISQRRFSLPTSEWVKAINSLNELNVKVVVHSKQYLEDCIENRTELIAIQGIFIFEDREFSFTGQLDVQGYGLYVDELDSKVEPVMRFSELLTNKYGENA